MKKSVFSKLTSWLTLGALTLLVSGLISSQSYAADKQLSWNGLYAGVNVGYGWGGADTTIVPLPSQAGTSVAGQRQPLEPDGVIGGMQIGYDLQKELLVFGIETDFSGTDMNKSRTLPIIKTDGTFLPYGNVTLHQDLDWLGTLRLKLGVTPHPRLLLFGSGGLAYGDVKFSANVDYRPVGTIQYPGSKSGVRVGMAVGGGAEVALFSKVSVRSEYLYYDLGNADAIGNPIPAWPPYQKGYHNNATGNIFRIAVNYRF